MKLLQSRLLWGVVLIVMGVLFLVESLGLLALGGAWSVLFFAAAAAFASTFIGDREAWWAVIPAMAMFGIGVLILFGVYLEPVADQWGASLFLGSLALAFWIIYFSTRRSQWWAIIPGGVLLVLAVAIGLEPYLGEEGFVAAFMLGLGLTFALLYFIPTSEGRMGWALIPAAIMGIIGLAFLIAAANLTASAAGLIWPLILILVGGYLLLRSLRRQ